MSIATSLFIHGNSTPLRNLIKSKIVYSTIFQNVMEEAFAKSEESLQKISDQLYGDYGYHFQLNLHQLALTATLLIVATIYNYDIIYNRKISSSPYTQNIKIIIMVILFILTKNVDSVL